MPFASLAVLVGLVAVHLFAGRLRFLHRTPRSIWLSTAGGVSVAYVFVHLLPEVARGERVLAETTGHRIAAFEHEAFFVSLGGLTLFYGLERLAARSRAKRKSEGYAEGTEPNVYRIHLGTFALYNAIIGYLLARRHEEEGGLWFFGAAMGLHFLVNDYGLQHRHASAYERSGRWIVSVAIVAGWALAWVARISEGLRLLLMAFLAGGVVLNVLKEELPEERSSRFWAFLLGVSVSGSLFLAS